MNKRGQLTIFIIIVILIVAVIVIFFMFRDNLKIGGVPHNIEPFYINLISCLENTANEGVYFIAAHGGYYNVPFSSSIIYFTDDIPYYYLENNNLVPEIEDVEKELGDYISENLEDCVDLEFYKNQGFEINIREYSILTNINEGEIDIKMLNSITIDKGDEVDILKNIEINIKKDLSNLYYASVEIVDSYSQKPGFVCLTCLDEIASEYDVNIESVPVNDVSVFNNDIIWYFITNKYDNSYDKLKWVFVVEK